MRTGTEKGGMGMDGRNGQNGQNGLADDIHSTPGRREGMGKVDARQETRGDFLKEGEQD